MWVNKQEWESMKIKIAALEQKFREQQESLNLIIESRDEELKQMKLAFAEIKENIQSGILEEILKSGH